MPEELTKRTHVYVQRPKTFGLSGCKCGNQDPDWSEYQGHLWCQYCKIDFIPEEQGVFGGPVGIHACELMGIYFDRIRLMDSVLEPDPLGTFHFEKPA